MTLIAGTIVWNGICVGADTRATNTVDKTYNDDMQKIDMLSSGLGIAVAGSCYAASIFRDILSKNLGANTELGDGYDGPAEVVKRIIEKSLNELEQDSRISSEPLGDMAIAGLIIGIDREVSMRLNQEECKKVLEIISNKEAKNSVWKKYGKDIINCAEGKVEYIELEEFPHSTLFSFNSTISEKKPIQVSLVPFGEIKAWGSGLSKDHDIQQKNTLFYALFQTEPDQIDDSAVHIIRTHGWSEKVVPIDPLYKFQTFGGGYLAGAFLETPPNSGMVMFRVTLGEYFRDAQKTDLVCSVYPNSKDELCVKTGDGKEWILKKFWEYGNKANISMHFKPQA